MTINDALPLKATRRDATAKLKSFWGFELRHREIFADAIYHFNMNRQERLRAGFMTVS